MKSFSNLLWGMAWTFCLGGAFGLGACSTRQDPPRTLPQAHSTGDAPEAATPATISDEEKVEAPEAEPSASPSPEASVAEPVAQPAPILPKGFDIAPRPTPHHEGAEDPNIIRDADRFAQAEAPRAPEAAQPEQKQPVDPMDIAEKARADMQKVGTDHQEAVSEEQAYFGGLASEEGTPLYSDSEAKAKADELSNAGVDFGQFKQMHAYLQSLQDADDQNPATRFAFRDQAAVDKAIELSKQGYQLDPLRRTTEFFTSLVDPQTQARVMPVHGALESAANLVRTPNFAPEWLINRYNEVLANAAGPREALDQVFGEVGR